MEKEMSIYQPSLAAAREFLRALDPNASALIE
jgi:hypothetical protein